MEEDNKPTNYYLQDPNDFIVQGTSDLYVSNLHQDTMYIQYPTLEVVPQIPPVSLTFPEIEPIDLSNTEPIDLTSPTNNEGVIDLTDDDPSSPALSDDCIALLPDGSPWPSSSSSTRNSDSFDESVSIVYENIKPPPDLHVEFEQGSGDLVVEIMKTNPEPFSGCLTKKIKLGQNHVSVSVAVNTKSTSIISESSHQGTQKIRGKISVPHLFGASAPVSQPEIKPPTPPPPPSNMSTVKCGICLDTYDEITSSDRNLVSTACGHVFCNVCIEQCKTTFKHCPKCRKKLTKRQYHPLYFS